MGLTFVNNHLYTPYFFLVSMSEDNMIFDGSQNQESKQKQRPILENNGDGAAAWLKTDKNGNAYISVSLPLGLGSLQLFAANEDVRDAFNQLKRHLDTVNNQ